MTSYSTPASGRLWVPAETDGEPKTDEIIEQLRALGHSDPIIDNDEPVKVEDMYYSDGQLDLTMVVGGWLVSVNIPLQPSRAFRGVLSDLNEAFDIASRESGYFLANPDVGFVDTFTPDGQGRVTLGREYAGEEVRLIGSVVDSE